jgi:hypothetical protein
MTTARVALPEHPDDLRQYCAQLLTELHEQSQLVEKLTHELALFRRYLYGRRSERLDVDPAQLLLEFASWLKAMQAATPVEAVPGSESARWRLALATPPALRPCCRWPARAHCRRIARACGARLKIGEDTSSSWIISHSLVTSMCGSRTRARRAKQVVTARCRATDR